MGLILHWKCDFHHKHYQGRWIVGFVLWPRTSNVSKRVSPQFFTTSKEDDQVKTDVCILGNEGSCSPRIDATSHNNKLGLLLGYHGKLEMTDKTSWANSNHIFMATQQCETTHKCEDSRMSGCTRLWSVNSSPLQPRHRTQQSFFGGNSWKELDLPRMMLWRLQYRRGYPNNYWIFMQLRSRRMVLCLVTVWVRSLVCSFPRTTAGI